ncbi:tRNA synthetase class II core domain family protein, partial [Chlamydia psittaci 06-1683]
FCCGFATHASSIELFRWRGHTQTLR